MHWDWLFSRVERPGGDLLGTAGEPRELVAFRLGRPPVFAVGQAEVRCEAEGLPAHRLRYLAFEGEIGGGRGRVARVANGWWEKQGDAIRFRLEQVPGLFAWRAVGQSVLLRRADADDALDLAPLLNR